MTKPGSPAPTAIVQDPDSLLASYESLDHRLVPERVDVSPADQYPIQNQVDNLENRYEIIREIARGGHKQICEAHDHVTDRVVALATLHGSASAAESEAFLREARLHASLAHPNVLRVYDLGILPDNRAFFTMTLMTGRTLADLIAENTPLAELLDVFLRVCDGVAYAHSRQILHLDLKPQNVQVGRFGEVFVSDWGLARIGEQAPPAEDADGELPLEADLLNHFTLSGTIKGTPGYMAPEQVTGEPATVATDVYGLGALLYSILTGTPVIAAENTRQALAATKAGSVPRPQVRTPDREVPGALEAVCMRALARHPDQRYPDVAALRHEITRYRDGFATDAQDADAFDHFRLLVKRHKTITVLAAVFLAVLLATTTAFIQRLRQSERTALAARDQAILQQQLAQKAEYAAIQARDEATASLQALRAARRQKAHLADMFSTWLLADSRKIYDDQITSKGPQHQFLAVKEKIDAAFAQAPEDPDVLAQKVYVDFIFQDFQAAHRTLQATREPDLDNLRRIFADLAKRQTDGDQTLPELTVHALRILPPERDELARYLFLNAAATKDFDARPAIVKAMLMRENPDLPAAAFRYRKPSRLNAVVDLSSTPELTTIQFETEPHDHCLLYRLNPVEVNLCDTNVSKIDSLSHVSRLRKLKIAGSPIRDLSKITTWPSLEYLLVDERQFQTIQRLNLRKNLVVEVRPDQ